MAEPRIQYARTEDGVNIAYSESGHGTPYVLLTDLPMSHVQLERKYLPGMHQPENWARLIRLDPRGTGMSDREVQKFSLDSWLLDIDAVVNRLGLDRFALGAVQYSGVLALAYAARNPERVSRLCLLNAFARPADAFANPVSQTLGGMLVTDWEMFCENVGSVTFGWGREEAHVFAEYVRACTTHEEASRIYAALAPVDVTDLLPSIAAPTLVLHHTGSKAFPLELGRRLVSLLPDSRLVVIEGVFTPTMDEIFEPIHDFLEEGATTATQPADAEASAFRTILFTDLVGHTEMMSRLGDERGRDVLREHERITREVLKANGGTEVKTMGDGFMASFGSVTKAVECAIALQRAFADWNAGVGAQHVGDSNDVGSSAEIARRDDRPSSRRAAPLQVRVGLNAGEPIEEDGDLFGATVILASRIAAKAGGGEILVADTVRGLCSGKGFLFADRGEFVAKGIEEPVRISEVRWGD
jgi:class 3 adenylate cyclase/pimeloyl-ACP methyl ester carboxylesterase